MAIIDKLITEKYALYHGDCFEVLPEWPDNSIHLMIYSPPFGNQFGTTLYQYSSDPRDLSNTKDYEEFLAQYEFAVKETARILMPGRLACVHCMDVPTRFNLDFQYTDFAGDIIRLHQKYGMKYKGRHCIWHEPLGVRNRTRAKHLAHKQIVDDSAFSGPAGNDYLLLLQKQGDNDLPVAHPNGFTDYIGAWDMPQEYEHFRGYEGHQVKNKWSHTIWQRYASGVWMDIRTTHTIPHVLPFKPARDEKDEKHIHPLQLDVIERCVQLYSNPGEIVLSPFAGVGSEPYGAVINGRKGVGIELKASYYRQAVKNLEHAANHVRQGDNLKLFDE